MTSTRGYDDDGPCMTMTPSDIDCEEMEGGNGPLISTMEAEKNEDEEELPKVTMMGQDRNSKERSSDVVVMGKHETIEFSDMQLSEDILKGLRLCRYEKPTPIQLNAIPLGKLNRDLLLQAKSGTGKTCVFTVCVLQEVVVSEQHVQALILSPCREVSVQIANVLRSIGAFKEGLKVKEFIGGTSVPQSIRRTRKCHVAVGTPGRMAHMVKEYNMDLSKVRVVALDEADKLMDPSFFKDVQVILNALPGDRQIIATSATYSETVLTFLGKFMNNPHTIQLDASNPSLTAVDQYLVDVKKIVGKSGSKQQVGKPNMDHSTTAILHAKFEALKQILNRVPYTQVMVFANYILRAESIYEKLKELDLDVDLLSGARSQEDRLTAFNDLKQGKCRIMVATDVASRGIDVEGVDMIVNFDIPNESATYIHRVGRTGRFGAFGKALALCYTESEKLKLSEHQSELKFAIFLVEKVEELNSIEKYSKTAQNVQKYRQLKGMKEPLTLQDSLLKNWKEIFLECMAKPRPEDNDWKYLKHGSFRNGLELHEGRRFREEVEGDFQKALEKQRKRRLNLEDDENPSNEEDSCKAGNGQWSDSSVDEDSEENDSVDESDNDDTELL